MYNIEVWGDDFFIINKVLNFEWAEFGVVEGQTILEYPDSFFRMKYPEWNC